MKYNEGYTQKIQLLKATDNLRIFEKLLTRAKFEETQNYNYTTVFLNMADQNVV